MKYVCADFGSTDGCCGVTQIYGFCGADDSRRYGEIEASGETVEEAYKNLFDKIQSYNLEESDWNCGAIQIWFYKGHDYQKKDNEEYEAAPLMRLVEQSLGVVCLGEFRNPNTNNLIKGYQWAV